jgi:hypothetical protein
MSVYGVPDVQERYNTDPTFRRTVDMLHAIIRSAELSPAEVRQAAGLAAIHYEMYRTLTFDVEFTPKTRGLTQYEAEKLMRSRPHP